MPSIFPFTAIVGQERMRRALILNAVDTRIGGVLIRGERGTAKSTAARALAALLPSVKVVNDCRFGCDPDRPSTWCTECKERFNGASNIPAHVRTTSFVNLPVSAKPPIESLQGLQAVMAEADAAFGEEGRHLIRYSGTEKKIRILVEHREQEAVDHWIERFSRAITEELG